MERLGRLALLIRAPSKSDEVQRVLNSRQKREPDDFEKVILALINHTFSSDQGWKMPESLQLQLASSVAYRRDRLIYEWKHDQKLSADRNESNVSESAPTVMAKRVSELLAPMLPKVSESQGRVSQVGQQPAHATHSQPRSTVRPKIHSGASSSYSTNPLRTAEYPDAPTIPPGHLEMDCTYCRRILAKKVLEDKKQWV